MSAGNLLSEPETALGGAVARVKVCGVCWKPVLECICDEDPEFTTTADDDEAA